MIASCAPHSTLAEPDEIPPLIGTGIVMPLLIFFFKTSEEGHSATLLCTKGCQSYHTKTLCKASSVKYSYSIAEQDADA